MTVFSSNPSTGIGALATVPAGTPRLFFHLRIDIAP